MNERVEDLQYKGLRIIQPESGFRFGTDSVLLAGFAKVSRSERFVDLCAGTGVLSILINGRTQARGMAVEIQPQLCDMARRSFLLNGQELETAPLDVRTAFMTLGEGAFDVAVSNPPYHKVSSGAASKKGAEGYSGAATHEVYITDRELCKSASRLLKFGGRFYLSYPTSRLADIIDALRANGLEPKRIRPVASVPSKLPYLVLIEAKKGAYSGLVLENTLVIANADGTYTDEVNAIYHRIGSERRIESTTEGNPI